MEEEFRAIKNHPEYLISNKGNVISIRGGKRKTLTGTLNNYGYRIFRFATRGKYKDKTLLAHRLVAEAFLPNPDNYSQVNHKNAIKTDNTIENLEWCTPLMNMRHAADMGLMSSEDKKGIRTSIRYSDAEMKKIKRMCLNKSLTNKKIGEMFGCTESYITMIKNGQRAKNIIV